MRLILDEREVDLYEKCYSILYTEEPKLQNTVILTKRVLLLGDAVITTDDDETGEHPILMVERKGFRDLLASIKDGRYEEQSYRLVHSSRMHLHNIMYVVEGIFSQLKSLQEKKIVYSAMTTLNYFKGFSVLKTSSVRETAELVVYMTDKIVRDMQKGKIPAYTNNHHVCSAVSAEDATAHGDNDADGNAIVEAESDVSKNSNIGGVAVTSMDYCDVVKKVKKDNITSANIGLIMLSQIPGISSVTAKAIMQEFQSFPQFMEKIREDPGILDNIKCGPKKLSKTSVSKIKEYLIGTPIQEGTDT